MESKWSDRMSQYTDDRKTPDLSDHINAEEYNTLSKLILLLIICIKIYH